MRKTPKVLVLVGCPAVGKSTFAENYAKTNNILRINRDDMRKMLQFSEQLSIEDEALLSRMIEKMVEVALKKGRDVLLDNTHLRADYLIRIIEKFSHLADVEFKVLEADLDELLRRNEQRIRKVPENVIKEMFHRFQQLKTSFDFSSISKKGIPSQSTAIQQDTTLQSAILCDLDGTLAMANGRNMFRPSDDEMYADTLNIPVQQALKGLAIQNKLIFLSGREDCFMEISKKWIKEKAGIDDFEIFMRKTDDNRKDSIIKEEILRNEIIPKYHVIGVFDDRMQVCRMWYEKGVFCFNVNQGLIEF